MNLHIFTNVGCALKGSSGFLGFPTWYKYLAGVESKVDSVNVCTPSLTSLNSVWLIAIAIIEILLRVAAIVAVGVIIYAGIGYITSQGEPEKTAKSKNMLINALVGLAIAISATAIVSFLAGRFK